jgi:hypothetical protein
MMTLLAALFCECRLVFTATSNYRLSSVINSLLRLMYPFQWQHMFIPLLSEDSVGLIKFDRPYIIGVNSCLTKLIMPLPSEVVHVDLDREMVQYRPGSFVQFPAKAKSRLSKAIRKFTAGLVFPPLNLAAAFQEAIERKTTSHRRAQSINAAPVSLNGTSPATTTTSPTGTSTPPTTTSTTPTHAPSTPNASRLSTTNANILPPSAQSIVAAGGTLPTSSSSLTLSPLSSSAPASLTVPLTPLSLTVPNSPAGALIGLTPLGPGPVARFPHSQSTPHLGRNNIPANGPDNLTDHILSNEKAFVGNGSDDASAAIAASSSVASSSASTTNTSGLHAHAAATSAAAEHSSKAEAVQHHMASMAALRLLRDTFVTVFVSLFYKYRLFWEKE